MSLASIGIKLTFFSRAIILVWKKNLLLQNPNESERNYLISVAFSLCGNPTKRLYDTEMHDTIVLVATTTCSSLFCNCSDGRNYLISVALCSAIAAKKASADWIPQPAQYYWWVIQSINQIKHGDGGSGAVENHVTFDLWHTTVGMWDIFSTFLWCCSPFSLIFCITFRVSGHFTYSIHRKNNFKLNMLMVVQMQWKIMWHLTCGMPLCVYEIYFLFFGYCSPCSLIFCKIILALGHFTYSVHKKQFLEEWCCILVPRIVWFLEAIWFWPWLKMVT